MIGLAISAHIKCKYCTYFHRQAAEARGATAEEMREAATVGGMTTLFSNAVTGAQVDFESFKRDVDRAIDNVRQKAA